tara:strand:- start:34 stop:375 length:342 start_codon:yes stop_codon:yes gene_type:complete
MAGFTLLEVLVTLGILSAMVLFVSQITRSGFDMRSALNRKSKITHRMNTAMRKISDDLSHAFLVSLKNMDRTGGNKKQRGTFFKIEAKEDTDKLKMTVRNHVAMISGQRESDQ